MLDPTWAPTRPILWLALAGLLVLLVLRTVRKDRREYQRFKRYRTTAKRQAMFRKWLLESFVTFGGLSVAILLLSGAYVRPLLLELQRWNVLRDIRRYIGEHPEVVAAVIVGLVIGLSVLTLVGIRATRKEKDITAIGDIQAMLPRNRQELGYGAVLSINAGVVEEFMFRLALPALVFGASGSAVAAILGPMLLFGALHLYQGPAGIIGTAFVGALMMALYIVSGSILVPIVLHALFDLRSLVLIPVTVMAVHTVDGRAQPYISRRAVPAVVPAAESAAPHEESAAPHQSGPATQGPLPPIIG